MISGMFRPRLRLALPLFLILLASSTGLCQITVLRSSRPCRSHVPLDQALFDSIRAGSFESAIFDLQRGADPNARDGCGVSALAYAAADLRPGILEELLKRGADVNVRDDNIGTPLVWALDFVDEDDDSKAKQRLGQVVRLLAGAGADVNVDDDFAGPLLILAAQKGLDEAAETLIDWGAQVNATDNNDRTAYSYAAQLGNKKLKTALLAAGADPAIGVSDYKSKYGKNAFIQASSDGRTDIVEAMLASGFDVNYANQAGVTAVMRVVADSTLDALLAAGADVNKRDNAGFTALIWASFFGRTSQVRKLIAAGSDVNAVADGGETALSMAKQDVKPILVQAGAWH